MSKLADFCEDAASIDIGYEVLEKCEAKEKLKKLVDVFTPSTLFGHFSIGHDMFEINASEYQYIYSKFLNTTEGYIFFTESQERMQVVKLKDISLVSNFMENSYRIDYFLTDKDFSFLISVNQYVVECTNNLSGLLEKL